MIFILSALWGIRIRGLWKLPDERDWLLGIPGFVLMGGALLGKSWIQFSVWWLGLCSLPVAWPEAKIWLELMKIMAPPSKSFMHCCTQCPQPWSRPPPTHASSRDSWIFTGKSGSSLVESMVLYPGSWCIQGFACALQESVSPVLHKFWWLYGGVSGDFLQKCYTIPPIQEFSYGSHTPYAAKILICQCPLPCLVIRMF